MWTDPKVALAGAAAAVVLAAGTTAALAASTGGASPFGGTGTARYGPADGPHGWMDTDPGARMWGPRSGPSDVPRRTVCPVPELPGRAVDVTLTDSGAMMGGPAMMGGWSGADRPGWSGDGRPGVGRMMAVRADPATVRAGTVSFAVANDGVLTHELVVLPLGGNGPGGRAVGADGSVSEQGSLGEASATCGAGEGDGIRARSQGWVTLDLGAGRYELVCNLPGHYAARDVHRARRDPLTRRFAARPRPGKAAHRPTRVGAPR